MNVAMYAPAQRQVAAVVVARIWTQMKTIVAHVIIRVGLMHTVRMAHANAMMAMEIAMEIGQMVVKLT